MGRITGEHLVEHTPQRIDVGPPVQRPVPSRLLGTHVLRSAERKASLGDPCPTRLRDCQGDAEVGHYRLSVGQQDILGFEVPVDDAAAMGVVEGSGNRDRQMNRLIHRELTLAEQAGPERLTLDVWHGVPQVPIRSAGVEQGQQVGMLQVGCDSDLA
jgi:hypothetical protein